jgi:hypothetical protein
MLLTQPKQSIGLLRELVDRTQFRRIRIPRAIVTARIDVRDIDAVTQ